MSFTTALAEWAHKTYSNNALAPQNKDLQLLFLDWLACVGAGLSCASTQSLIRSLKESHAFTVDLGHFSSFEKAKILGFASHCKEMDDSEFTGETHPSAVILSALLSAAKDQAPMEQVLRCAWVGYQSLRSLGKALNPEHYNRGWHGTGTVGIYASTLSVCLLLNFKSDQIENALGISATLSSGIQASFGTQSKYLNSANASANAVLSAKLTQNGMSGPRNVFESKYGVFQMFKGNLLSCDFDFEQNIDTSLNWIKTKKYPGCHCLEPIVEAALSLTQKIPDHKKIQKVRLFLSSYDLNIVNQRSPQNIESAFFSASYVTAYCLIYRKMSFTTQFFSNNQDVVNLEAQIDLVEDSYLAPMECRMLIECSDNIYEASRMLNRKDSRIDEHAIEQKIISLFGIFSKNSKAFMLSKEKLSQKNVTVGEIKEFVRENLGFSL